MVVEHDLTTLKNRIRSEELKFDEQRLYQFDGKDAHLFRDDGSAGPVFPLDWSRSGITTIPERPDNSLLTWFRHRLKRIYIFSPDPLRMTAQSDAEVAVPDRSLHQVASWLRHLILESPDVFAKIVGSLKDGVLDGLVGFKLVKAGETTRILKSEFEFAGDANGAANSSFLLNFDQLSEGQRNLVALFTVLHSAVADADSTLCLDEPDNYVALREIQPWLIELIDRTRETGSQCLLISHHPEFINYLASSEGIRFFRDNGPVRSQPFQWTKQDGVLPAEIVARGWE